jgi:hypothetical protein
MCLDGSCTVSYLIRIVYAPKEERKTVQPKVESAILPSRYDSSYLSKLIKNSEISNDKRT